MKKKNNEIVEDNLTVLESLETVVAAVGGAIGGTVLSVFTGAMGVISAPVMYGYMAGTIVGDNLKENKLKKNKTIIKEGLEKREEKKIKDTEIKFLNQEKKLQEKMEQLNMELSKIDKSSNKSKHDELKSELTITTTSLEDAKEKFKMFDNAIKKKSEAQKKIIELKKDINMSGFGILQITKDSFSTLSNAEVLLPKEQEEIIEEIGVNYVKFREIIQKLTEAQHEIKACTVIIEGITDVYLQTPTTPEETKEDTELISSELMSTMEQIDTSYFKDEGNVNVVVEDIEKKEDIG